MLLLTCFLSVAAAAPVLDVTPTHLAFGREPYGSSTNLAFEITNVGSAPVAVSVDAVFVPDDFSPGQLDSTCPMTGPTTLAPGASCVHVVGYQPTEVFAGPASGEMRVTARSDAGAIVAEASVTLSGRGYAPRDVVVDFTDHGQGVLRPKDYSRDGVRFLDGEFVGWVQGDEALVGPVEFTVPTWTDAAILTFAPSNQGSAWYTLEALGSRGEVLASTRALVTQDEGDPSTGPFGYTTIALSDVPAGTRSLALSNEFLSSSYEQYTEIGFAVAEIELLETSAGR